MAVASKFLDTVPMDLKFMDEHVVHHKIPANTLKSLERTLLQTVQFWICAPNEYDFLLALLESPAWAVCLPKPIDAPLRERLQEAVKFVATANLFKYAFCGYAPSLKAAATLLLVLSKECSIVDLGRLSEILARSCETEISALQNVASEIETHLLQFRSLHPRLQRIFQYRTPILS